MDGLLDMAVERPKRASRRNTNSDLLQLTATRHASKIIGVLLEVGPDGSNSAGATKDVK